jgi:hypothetical protein
VYRAVVLSLAWPSKTWITRTSVFASNRCVAKLCRRVCSVAGLDMGLLSFIAHPVNTHIFKHPLTQRAHSLLCHRILLFDD